MSKFSPLGKRILQAIKDQRLKKKDVYEKMGISRGTLDNWIAGTTAPDHDQLEIMLKFLGISAQARSFRDEIFEGDYIGLHKRVWTQIEENMVLHRDLIKDLSTTVKNLTQAGNS